jgi:uncharacterized protein
MSDIPRRLKQLEKLLASLDDDEAMLLSELDGFLAGILVCPDLIMPSEWLPMVWGRGNKDAAPVLENTNQAEQLVGLIMERYNAVAAELQRGGGHYEPLFDVDTRHNEILWEIWIDGFDTALQLRPEAWAKVRGGDGDALSALAGLVALVQIGRGESTLPKEQIDEITAKAPDLIPHYIETLNAWRIGQQVGGQFREEAPNFGKVGRNEPCPCGSGKKYKRCCGLN